MNLGILQLSDIHFKKSDNHIISKREKIISAINCRVSNVRKILILVNGDTAFSGSEIEYSVAFDFFSEIKERFEKEGKEVDILFVAGNHDCEFSSDEAVRDILISNIDRESNFNVESSIVSTTMLQTNYKMFAEAMESENRFCKTVFENEVYRNVILFCGGEYQINFNLYNTAWISELHEQPGQMIMPLNMIKASEYKESFLNISVLHHPTHWLSPNNKREFDEILFDTSDIVLTGHEHMDSTVKKVNNLGEVFYVEASALQENWNKETSGFKLFKVNNDDKKINVLSFEWDIKNILYKVESEKELPFSYETGLQIDKKSSIANRMNTFKFSNYFGDFLNELGAPISHSAYGNLSLSDIYILPDFRNEIDESDDERKTHIDSVDFEKYALSEKDSVFLITGDKESGKTSLIKYLSKTFFFNEIYPICLTGKELNNRNFDKILEKKFEEQYEGDIYEKYLQYPKEQKVVLIDDWNEFTQNSRIKSECVSSLKYSFNNIFILMNDDSTSVTNLLSIAKDVGGDVKNYSIKKFGYVKREELVEKWVRLDNENKFLEEEDISFKIRDNVEKVNLVIGKSYIPQFPLYVLIVLQSIQNGVDLKDFNNQTNSYFYEILIKQLLMKVGINTNQTSTLENYLCFLAYAVFKSPNKSLNYDDWKKFHENYVEKYYLEAEKYEFSDYRKKLISSGLMKRVNDSTFTFNYKYVLFYFTAKWLSDHLSEEQVKIEVEKLIIDIDVEINSSVIIFLTHLTRNSFVIEKLITVANTILSDEPILELGEDVTVLNQLVKELPEMYLKDNSVKDNRLEYNHNKDLSDEQLGKDDHYFNEENENALDQENNELREQSVTLKELNRAVSMTEAMGQILKNYSGTIPAQQKNTLCETAYLVSLRAGTKLLDFVKSEKEDLISFTIEMMEKELKSEELENPRIIEEFSKMLVFRFSEMIVLSIIQKIASDTSSRDLSRTYEKISEMYDAPIISLIITTSGLEHGSNKLAINKLHDVYETHQGNVLVKSVSQKMAYKYLYLNELNFRERQRISKLFNIKYDLSTQKMISKKN